eukprot:1426339-Prymnesium_polylepis.1
MHVTSMICSQPAVGVASRAAKQSTGMSANLRPADGDRKPGRRRPAWMAMTWTKPCARAAREGDESARQECRGRQGVLGDVLRKILCRGARRTGLMADGRPRARTERQSPRRSTDLFLAPLPSALRHAVAPPPPGPLRQK